MKNWRPKEGWEIPVSIVSPQCSEVVLGDTEHEMIYEAGADAMLEALRKEGYRLDMEQLGCGFVKDTAAELSSIRWWAYNQVADSKLGQGYAVFIPDDD